MEQFDKYFDKETVKLHVEILRILYRKKGHLQAHEIQEGLPKIHLPKLLKPVRFFPRLKQTINYHMAILEMIGLVSGFDKDGFEREYIPSSEKYYELTRKGETVVMPKSKENFANVLFELIGEKLVRRSGKPPEEIYKGLSELIEELDN